jgi:hypothetical protein
MADRDQGAARASRHDVLVWLASWAAPMGASAALVLFGLFVLWPRLRGLGARVELLAWALGLCLVVAVLSHLIVSHHGATSTHFTHDEKAELQFKLRRGRGYGHWRRLMRQKRLSWYKGRSHSGERPRFD